MESDECALQIGKYKSWIEIEIENEMDGFEFDWKITIYPRSRVLYRVHAGSYA